MSKFSPLIFMVQSRFDHVIAWATRLSPIQAGAITTLALIVVGGMDALIGPEVWFGPLYLLIICLPAWSIGVLGGVAAGLAAMSVNALANNFIIHPGSASPAALGIPLVWNFLMRILSICIIICLVSGFRRQHDREWTRARRDGLTGVLNRHGFEEEVAVNRNPREWAVLAYMDLDGFKRVNDCHGHATGDALLRSFSWAALGQIRLQDSFARIGGDEFLLYMPVRDEQRGRKLVEQLHGRMSELLARTGYPVHLSMGALLISPGPLVLSAHDIALADRLMYEAKEQGAAFRVELQGVYALRGGSPAPAGAESSTGPGGDRAAAPVHQSFAC